MATKSPPTQTKSLDDLPQEILDIIWQHYFTGRKVAFKSRKNDVSYDTRRDNRITTRSKTPKRAKVDQDLGLVWIISRRQRTAATAAMLRHTTLVLRHPMGVAVLLCNYRDELCSIQDIRLEATDSICEAPFSLMDDFFRACKQLQKLELTMRKVRSSGYVGDAADVRKYLLQQVKALISNAFFSTECAWIIDIISNKAFAHSDKSPTLTIELGLSLENASWPHSLPVMWYDTKNKQLTGFVKGQDFVIPQVLPDSDSSPSRGGRGQLCDAKVINKDVQDRFESIGQGLGAIERVKFARYEDVSDIATKVENLEGEISILANEIYRFDCNTSACGRLLAWLIGRLNPDALTLDTYSEAKGLVESVLERPLKSDELQMLLETWRSQGNGWSRQKEVYYFRHFWELYDLLKPVFAVRHGERSFRAECFDKLCNPLKGQTLRQVQQDRLGHKQEGLKRVSGTE